MVAKREKKGVKIVQEIFTDINIIPRGILEISRKKASSRPQCGWREGRNHAGKPLGWSFLFTADGGGCLWLLVACAHIPECIWAPFLSGDPGQLW